MKDLGCKKTRKLVALLPGNDLPQDKDQPVRDHLASCPACQRELGDHLRVRSALSRSAGDGPLRHPHVDAAFFAAMKRSILHRVRQNEAPRVARQSSLRLNLARAMTAAAMILLTVYLVPPLFQTAPELPDPDIHSSEVSDPLTYGLNPRRPQVGLQGQDEMRRELEMDGDVEDRIMGNRLILVQPVAPDAGAKGPSRAKKSSKKSAK